MDKLEQLKAELQERAEGLVWGIADGSANPTEYAHQCGRIQELLGVVEDIEEIINGKVKDGVKIDDTVQ